MLLDAKADVDATDGNLNTALHYAAGYGKEDMVNILARTPSRCTQNLGRDRGWAVDQRLLCVVCAHSEALSD